MRDTKPLGKVATIPWPGQAGAERPVGDAMGAAIERHVAAAIARLWPALRGTMRAGGALVDIDLPRLLDTVLTGDELSYTVYQRIDAFVDLVAAELVAAGDYRWRSASGGSGAAR